MTSDEKSTTPSEDTKRKFREALERKNKQNAQRGEAKLEGDSVVHSASGRADHKREFRRKTG